jgi:FMN-dependent NADH-azoreductase
MNRRLLRIDASARTGESDSRRLTDAFVEAWLEGEEDGEVTVRDIVSSPLPHLDEALLEAFSTPAEERTAGMEALVARSDELVAEFLSADDIVIGVPMYNFGIPSTLKAYIDQITRAGVTFRYTERGPVGLAGGRRVYLVSTRGGIYDESPMDHQVNYLKTLFGFLGIDAVEVIQAEGLNISETQRLDALDRARGDIGRVVEQARA